MARTDNPVMRRRGGADGRIALTVTPSWIMRCIEGALARWHGPETLAVREALYGCWNAFSLDRTDERAPASLPRHEEGLPEGATVKATLDDLAGLFDAWTTRNQPPHDDDQAIAEAIADLRRSLEGTGLGGLATRVFVDGRTDACMSPQRGAFNDSAGPRLSAYSNACGVGRAIVEKACRWHGLWAVDGEAVDRLVDSGEDLRGLLYEDLDVIIGQRVGDGVDAAETVFCLLKGGDEGRRLLLDEAGRHWAPSDRKDGGARSMLGDLRAMACALEKAAALLVIKELQDQAVPPAAEPAGHVEEGGRGNDD